MFVADKVFMAWPSRILFGNGERAALAPLLKKMGFRNALIVTDAFFTRGGGTVLPELVNGLAEAGIASIVFDGGQPDPSVALCEQAQRWAQAHMPAAGIDHLIAIGGGSNIDLAKALSVTLKYGGSPGDYMGEGKFPGKPIPLVAMPTTSGAGSEITPGAILVQEGSATKVALMDNDLRPVVVVVDPELTLSCPARVTADAGIDALTHAVESFLTLDSERFDRAGDPDPGYSGRNHLTRIMAAESIRLCFACLPTAFRDGSNLEARTGMAYSSLLAAFSYANAGLNAVHGLAYALAGLTHATHGSTNAVYLPYVMDSLLHERQAELADIGRMAGSKAGDSASLAQDGVRLTRELIAAVGIPTSLAGFGVKESDLPGLIENGLAVTRLTKAFPIQPANDAYASIVRNAFHGKLSAPGKGAPD